MYSIKLRSEGIIEQDGQAVSGEPLNLLSAQIVLAEDFTLRDYFKMLERYPLLVQLSEFFPSYLEQYRQCLEKQEPCASISHLEFSKTVEMIGFPEKRLEIYTAIKGVNDQQRLEIKPYKMDLLLELPIRLGRLRHRVFGDQVDVFEFDTVYTLFEFIDGIAWELSFHAMPEQCQIRR